MQIQAFFPDETVSFSDDLAQLVSPNVTFQHNLFPQGRCYRVLSAPAPFPCQIGQARLEVKGEIVVFPILAAVIPKLPSWLQAEPS